MDLLALVVVKFLLIVVFCLAIFDSKDWAFDCLEACRFVNEINVVL